MAGANSLLVFPLGSQNLQSAPLSMRHAKQHLGSPRTSDDWKRNVKDFENIWNLPHYSGAIDGKHVSIKSPLNSGLLYYNYKGYLA